MGEIFDGSFDDVLVEANEVYQKHKFTKGEGWKDCNITELRDKLEEEYGEVKSSKAYNRLDEKEYNELLDVINVALMLAKRLKKA